MIDMNYVKIYLSALAVASLTACSDTPDTPKEIELSDIPIQLDVNVGGITAAPFSRAAVEVQNHILTTENIANHTWANSINTLMTVDDRYWFQTWLNYQYNDNRWGFHNGYIDNDEHANKDGSQHYSDTEVKLYWPENHAVNMYFVANSIKGLTDNGCHKIVCESDIKIKGQTPYFHYKSIYDYHTSDILYGTLLNQKRPVSPQSTTITLHHAMAKLKFEFEVRTPAYRVEVENIELLNTCREGKFRFLNNGNIEWYDLANRGNVTHGAGLYNLERLYIGYGDGVKTAYFRTTDYDSDNPLDLYYYGKEFYYLVVPQAVKPARPPFDKSESAYLQLWLRVIATENNQLIYPSNGGDAGVWIPLGNGTDGVTWEQGKEYTYHIVFNDGAGWDYKDQLPVLSLIDVSCTVANWTEETWVNNVN